MKELEKEYQNAISLELPYLWDRIEAGVDEYEAEKKAAQKETQSGSLSELQKETTKETTKETASFGKSAPLPDTKPSITEERAAGGRMQSDTKAAGENEIRAQKEKREKVLYLIRRYAATAAGILVLIVGIGALGLSRKSQSTAPMESASYEASDDAMSESAPASDEAVEMADEMEAYESADEDMEDIQYAAPADSAAAADSEAFAPSDQPTTSNAATSASAASESTAESAMEEEDMAAEESSQMGNEHAFSKSTKRDGADSLQIGDALFGVSSVTPIESLSDVWEMGTESAAQIEEILRNEAGIHSPGEYGLIEEDPESSELPYGVTQETEYVRVWLRDASDEKAYIMTLVRDGDQKMSLLNVVKADAPLEAVYEADLQKEE